MKRHSFFSIRGILAIGGALAVGAAVAALPVVGWRYLSDPQHWKISWQLPAAAVLSDEAAGVGGQSTGLEKAAEEPVAPGDQIKIVFVGDLMFDRNVARQARRTGAESLFAGVLDIFFGTSLQDAPDAVIGNLEGALTTQPSIAERDSSILHFTFDPSFARVLKEVGFTAVSLANNHSLDFGRSGFKETHKYLKEAGVSYFGSPLNDDTISVKLSVAGSSFCLIGYHDLYTYDAKPALKEIAALRPRCDQVIIFAHWGEEYVPPTDRMRSLAHQFIDAGADLVIGAHPHIVQPVEVYRGRAIFYSLGNFIFDQDFSFETTHAIAVRAFWNRDDAAAGPVSFEIVPVTIAQSHAVIADEDDRQKVLLSAVDSTTPPEVLKSIVEEGRFGF